MVAGAGVLENSENKESALAFVEYLLSESAQSYFATETFEYPLVSGISPSVDLVPLDELNAVKIDLSNLADIQGTVQLLQDVGMLP